MIEYRTDDIFLAPAEAFVNPVNCHGVMGKGLALEFKRRFPDIIAPYAAACRSGSLRPGKVQIVKTRAGIHVANFPTKDDWRQPSRIEWIRSGLEDLYRQLQTNGLHTVALPALGCGLGGLPWPMVRAAIESAFASGTITAYVYPPHR